MVSAVVDPIKILPINRSQEEIDEIKAMMEAGALPRDYLDRHFEAVEKNVFGEDHRKDKHGEPIEQGIGSPGNMTRNCIEAYIKNQTERRNGPPEKGYEETLARMEAELEACNEKRKAKQTAARKKGR